VIPPDSLFPMLRGFQRYVCIGAQKESSPLRKTIFFFFFFLHFVLFRSFFLVAYLFVCRRFRSFPFLFPSLTANNPEDVFTSSLFRTHSAFLPPTAVRVTAKAAYQRTLAESRSLTATPLSLPPFSCGFQTDHLSTLP